MAGKDLSRISLASIYLSLSLSLSLISLFFSLFICPSWYITIGGQGVGMNKVRVDV
jgi:hypothetical protein